MYCQITFIPSLRYACESLVFFSGKTCLLKDSGSDEIGEKVIAMCEHLKVILKVQLILDPL